MPSYIKIISAGFYWLLLGSIACGQVGSPDADAEKLISYKTYTGNDKVFIYYAHPGENPSGTLRADAPGAGNFSFEWSKYNPDVSGWGAVFSSESGSAFSLVSGLDEGGYRVHVFNSSGVDTFYYAWLFIDNLEANVEKNSSGEIKYSKISCDDIKLNGSVQADRFFYYDPISHERIELLNGYNFLWTSDNEDLFIPDDDKDLELNTIFNPPAEDTWFILTATDSFGMEDVDSVFYESIHVRAEFSFEFYDKAELDDYVEPPVPAEDDAPLRVRFSNESVNGSSFHWVFSDSVTSDMVAEEFTEDVNYQPEYTYKIPDKYFPKIIATSDAGCIDSFQVEEPIIVTPSELEAPNVFSPEGLEQNRFFKVKFKSIKTFSIRIYSRTGNLVYKADVKDLYSWPGWDGNVMNSDRPASPGTYYYVIEATGYDEVRYHSGPYTGFVYLFRP